VRPYPTLGLTIMLVTLMLIGGGHAWSAWAQDQRRLQESEVRQSHLHRQIIDRDAVFESQRRIYMERFRRLEGQVRDREQDVVVLRARLATHGMIRPTDTP
jgi:hypothetical protein